MQKEKPVCNKKNWIISQVEHVSHNLDLHTESHHLKQQQQEYVYYCTSKCLILRCSFQISIWTYRNKGIAQKKQFELLSRYEHIHNLMCSCNQCEITRFRRHLQHRFPHNFKMRSVYLAEAIKYIRYVP